KIIVFDKTPNPEELCIKIVTNKRLEGVYELRLKLIESSFDIKKLKRRIIHYRKGIFPKIEIGYVFECNSLNVEQVHDG
ncbi:hypothetical protein PMAYCL1PPCAC_31798, partial [Pristionchus mayeri]